MRFSYFYMRIKRFRVSVQLIALFLLQLMKCLIVFAPFIDIFNKLVFALLQSHLEILPSRFVAYTELSMSSVQLLLKSFWLCRTSLLTHRLLKSCERFWMHHNLQIAAQLLSPHQIVQSFETHACPTLGLTCHNIIKISIS